MLVVLVVLVLCRLAATASRDSQAMLPPRSLAAPEALTDRQTPPGVMAAAATVLAAAVVVVPMVAVLAVVVAVAVAAVTALA